MRPHSRILLNRWVRTANARTWRSDCSCGGGSLKSSINHIGQSDSGLIASPVVPHLQSSLALYVVEATVSVPSLAEQFARKREQGRSDRAHTGGRT